MWICWTLETLIPTLPNLEYCLPLMAFNFVSQCRTAPPMLSVAHVPHGGSTGIIGAYDEDSTRWIELPPCIAGKASSLQSHGRVELTPQEISRNFDAPLHALSDIVLVEALCRSRAIFSLTLDCNSSFHVECLVLLSRICKTYPASWSIIVQVVDTCTMLYQFANPMLPKC